MCVSQRLPGAALPTPHRPVHRLGPRHSPAASWNAVGLARYTYLNFSSTCIEDPSAQEQVAPPPSPAPALASEAGKSSVSWLWIVLGTLLGLAAGGTAMLGLFIMRRRQTMAMAGADRAEGSSSKGAPSGSTDRQASAESAQSLEQDLEVGMCGWSGRSSLEATLWSMRYVTVVVDGDSFLGARGGRRGITLMHAALLLYDGGRGGTVQI